MKISFSNILLVLDFHLGAKIPSLKNNSLGRFPFARINKLIDFMCGSGTFLIEAVNQFLEIPINIDQVYLFLTKYNNWNIEYNLLLVIFIDLFLAGLSLKLGGKLAKGPYLPHTLEGLGKTTKAVLGKK